MPGARAATGRAAKPPPKPAGRGGGAGQSPVADADEPRPLAETAGD